MHRLTMVKQISLDTWSLQHLTDLLKKGSRIVAKTNAPIVLYRQWTGVDKRVKSKSIMMRMNLYCINKSYAFQANYYLKK